MPEIIHKVLNSRYEYLEGPNSRGKEFSFSIKVMWQLLKGFRRLHFVGPCITVFGSARIKEDNEYYDKARRIGKMIGDAGFTTMTGGGPGIMEAANRGAFESGGQSIGCAITLPKEQKVNPYMHKWVCFDFFFVRKVLLLKYSYAFIVLPGGFGTLDELFETVTLIQTAIIKNFPVVVLGTQYYKPVIELIEGMDEEETISEQDRKLILFTDDEGEALEHVLSFIKYNYRVKLKKTKKFWWLGE